MMIARRQLRCYNGMTDSKAKDILAESIMQQRLVVVTTFFYLAPIRRKSVRRTVRAGHYGLEELDARFGHHGQAEVEFGHVRLRESGGEKESQNQRVTLSTKSTHLPSCYAIERLADLLWRLRLVLRDVDLDNRSSASLLDSRAAPRTH